MLIKPGIVSSWCERCGGLRREWLRAHRRHAGMAGGTHRMCCCDAADCCTCGDCEFEIDVAQLRINLLQWDRCTYVNNDCTGTIASSDTFKTEAAYTNAIMDMCRSPGAATPNMANCYAFCGLWCGRFVENVDRAFSATCPPSGAFDTLPSHQSWEVCVKYNCTENYWEIDTEGPSLPFTPLGLQAITVANGWTITTSTCSRVQGVWGYTCNGAGDKDRVEVDFEVINNGGCEGI